MGSNSEPQQLPPAMPHDQQAIEQPERDCRRHEQVHRGNPISMVTKERPPSLRGRNHPAHHVFGHAGLADIDAKLEKLAMDPRCSPQRIGNAHLTDELAYFERHLRPAATASRAQAPVQPETSAMPANNGVRLHDRQRIANVWKKPVETNEYQAIEDAERGSLRSNPPQNVDLLAQCPISASSAARDRNRSTTAQPMSLKRSLITRQHRPILGQTPTGSGFRQG